MPILCQRIDKFSHKTELSLLTSIKLKMRTCSVCHINKNLNNFVKDKNYREGHRYYCKPCRNKSRKSTLEVAQTSLRQSTQGTWTLKDKQEAFIHQHGKCAICSTLLTSWRKAHADHNHITQQVRGLLCSKCNHLLGLADENQLILAQAISYLQKYASQ